MIGPDAPLEERLAEGTTLHGTVLARLVDMIETGEDHIAQRESDWNKVDEVLRMHVDLTRSAKDAEGSPIAGKLEQPVRRSFMIPVSYANYITRLSMMFGEMTSKDPMVHLEPVDSDDFDGARLHEAIIRWDVEQSAGPLFVWQTLSDYEKYGFSMVYDTWEEDYGWIHRDAIYPEHMRTVLPFHLQHLAEPTREWGLRKQYNRYEVVDPYRAIVDGSQSLWNPQRWQFAGHSSIVNWLHLEERRKRGDGTGVYFNVEKARKMSWADDDDSRRNIDGAFDDQGGDGQYPAVKLTHLQVKIIPREWKLSEVDRPEVWWFSVVNDALIVRAHPSVYRHCELTYSVACADLDMHAPFTAGTVEQLDGIQRLVDYLVFSHVENTRKMLNDAMIYDPSLLNERDLLQPGPGRHVRLTKRGQQLLQKGLLPIPNMWSQIGITDITGPHLQTAQLMMEQAQLLSGANATAQGQLMPHKRTLGEVEQAVAGSSQRVGAQLQLFDRQLISSLVRRHIINRQQFSTVEQMVRVSGDLARRMGQERLMIRPDELYGQYDYIPRTPTMASDPARMSATWGALMQVLGSAPQLLAPYEGKMLNPHAVFEEFAEAHGVSYLERFYVPAPAQPPGMPGGGGPIAPGQMRVVPDEMAMQQAQAGNAVPLDIPRAAM